jgi:tRNA(Ile)-lysidine synthase
MVTLQREVQSWIRRLGPGLYGVACSGGADSMALAHATIAVAGAANVVVITIDHGLQRDGSQLVVDSFPTVVKRAVVVEKRASLEAAARDARYAAFEQIAEELGLSWIFLGHTARDQAETVLMRILRGTGPAGLAGIPAQRGRFVRPFLQISRNQIDAYVHEQRLTVWEDPMNQDHSLQRTRIRETILPALRAENPAIDEALCRLAASAREWTEALDAQAEPRAQFPMAVTKRALSIALDRAGIGHDAKHLDAIVALDRTGAGVDLPGGRVERVYDQLVLAHPDLVARVWQPGDRMKPARLKGQSRKLSDLFIDAKVPRELRKVARVLVRDGEIVWAEHIGPAFGFRAC